LVKKYKIGKSHTQLIYTHNTCFKNIYLLNNDYETSWTTWTHRCLRAGAIYVCVPVENTPVW